MRALLRRFRPYAFDALIVVAAVGGTVEVVVTRGREDSVEGPFWVLIPMILLMTLPLLARRAFPFAAAVFVMLAAGSISFVEGRAVPYAFVSFLAVLTCSFLFGSLRDRRQAIAGLLIVIAVALVVTRNDPDPATGDWIFVSVVMTVSWLAGLALSRRFAHTAELEERAARLEREREERARSAVAEERARIARELHDVVGHSVSVMTVQASAVRRLLHPEQEKEREALLVVEDTGRQALAEMRRLVGVLRRPEEAPALAPQPSLEHLDKLVEQTRDAGLPVELRVEGEPIELPAGVDLTAYRLVQEGLTNALKHAGASKAEVLVRYGGDGVELVVSDDGRGPSDGVAEGGHGLVGMRERVSVYGGELEAGPRLDGGFALRARLPVDGA